MTFEGSMIFYLRLQGVGLSSSTRSVPEAREYLLRVVAMKENLACFVMIISHAFIKMLFYNIRSHFRMGVAAPHATNNGSNIIGNMFVSHAACKLKTVRIRNH